MSSSSVSDFCLRTNAREAKARDKLTHIRAVTTDQSDAERAASLKQQPLTVGGFRALQQKQVVRYHLLDSSTHDKWLDTHNPREDLGSATTDKRRKRRHQDRLIMKKRELQKYIDDRLLSRDFRSKLHNLPN